MKYIKIGKKNPCRSMLGKIGMNISEGAVFGRNTCSRFLTSGGEI